MKTLITLIRRELWEHRALWFVPLMIGVLMIALSLVASVFNNNANIQIHMDGKATEFLAGLNEDKSVRNFGVGIGGIFALQLMVMLIVLANYVLDTLYSERKDRSILFWKSMPVSDGMTVTSKVATALLVVPLWVYAVSLLTGVLCYAVLALRFAGTPLAAVASWDTGTFLTLQGEFLGHTLIASLWYAPVVAALLVISAWARRSPWVWATVPIWVAYLVEKIAFGTHYTTSFVAYRLTYFFSSPKYSGDSAASSHTASEAQKLVTELNVTPLLFNVDLWLGVVAAAGLMYVAVRLRRYRDDT